MRQATVVTPEDDVVKATDIFTAHRYPVLLHRAISVWLWRRATQTKQLEVFLQQRSQHKILGAGWYANAVCGNVQPTESYAESAYERLSTELNVTGVELKEIFRFQYQAYGNELYGEHELDTVFVGHYEHEIQPNPLEASQGRWVVWRELSDQVQRRATEISYPTAKQSLKMTTAQLKELLPPLSVSLPDLGHVLIAPWTVLMILDQRVEAIFSDQKVVA
jgi:isopentenyl-diphosphate Delta-isomerase